MSEQLPLHAMRMFAATASAGSVSAAARRLHVTHSAVSHQIKQLEGWLGCELFERHAAGVRVTPAGRELHMACERAFEDLARVCGGLRRPQAAPRVTLGCPGSFLQQWVIPRLGEVEAALDGTALALQPGVSVAGLHDGSVDALVVCGRERPPEGIVELCRQPNYIGPVCAPALAAAFQHEAAAPRQTLLGTRSYAAAWERWAQARGLPARAWQTRSFDQMAHMIQAAVAGLGVAVAPATLVQAELADGRLVAPVGFVAAGDNNMLWAARERADDAAVRALARWYDAALARIAPPAPV
ncbi:LysR family transcriptional regulator [Pseudomonadota bacterium AL_CKDN230030165-1A_HGKHYDSX7]